LNFEPKVIERSEIILNFELLSKAKQFKIIDRTGDNFPYRYFITHLPQNDFLPQTIVETS